MGCCTHYTCTQARMGPSPWTVKLYFVYWSFFIFIDDHIILLMVNDDSLCRWNDYLKNKNKKTTFQSLFATKLKRKRKTVFQWFHKIKQKNTNENWKNVSDAKVNEAHHILICWMFCHREFFLSIAVNFLSCVFVVFHFISFLSFFNFLCVKSAVATILSI